MGVWATGPDPTEWDFAGIAAAMRPTLYQLFNAHIKIYDAERLADGTPYNASADSGGRKSSTLKLVLDSGVNGAEIQPIRSPTRIEIGGQPNGLLGIRFQLKHEPTVESGTHLRGGLQVKVIDGGESAELTSYLYSLTETVGSSIEWGRIFDAVVITGGS